MKRIFVFLVLLVTAFSAEADIRLPSLFGSGMVLQQKTKVPLWGWADPGRTLTVVTSWDKQRYTVVPAADSSWSLMVTTPVAGGPFDIHINNGTVLDLKNVWIGEVWLASGQSNMDMPLKGFRNQPVNKSKQYIEEAGTYPVHFFQLTKISVNEPQKDCRGEWVSASPENAPKLSAVAYIFARRLTEKLKVPVGIIQSTWGGTNITSWMSRENLQTFPDVKLPEKSPLVNKERNAPAALFNGMIAPLVSYGIKGVIWYQGEHNRREPERYAEWLPAMVNDWRTRWKQGQWPFYFVQLAPIRASQDGEHNSLLAIMREVQQDAATAIPNAGMAVSIDAGEESVIHPAAKEPLADRLAALALSLDYGFKDVPALGPVYQKMKVAGNQLVLSFGQTDGDLITKKGEPCCFEIAGKDQVFYNARAEIRGNEIVLSHPSVKNPVAARYAFKAWVSGNVYNKSGLPLSSFRTDRWEQPSFYVEPLKTMTADTITLKAPVGLSFLSKVWHDRQKGQLRILVSSDYNGIYDLENIHRASWKDITSSFTLPEFGQEFQPSGNADLSSFFKKDKKLFIAVRYMVAPFVKADRQIWSRWSVNDIILTAGGEKIAIQEKWNWQPVLSKEYEQNRVRVRKNSWDFLGNSLEKVNATEAWLISPLLIIQ